MVRGEVVSPEGEDLPPVAQYLGIPYGVAPTGQVGVFFVKSLDPQGLQESDEWLCFDSFYL